MNRDHKTELEKIAPRLAQFKQHVSSENITEEYTDALYQKIKPVSKPAGISRNLRILTIAATFTGMIFMIWTLNHNLNPETVSDGVYETYVSDNWEEFEDMISEEIVTPDTWLEEELSEIPESDIISYLENNLDQFDLELLY